MKKKLHHTIIYYITVWLLVIFFTITSVTLITMQTVWGREKIKSLFIAFAKKNNINLQIGSVKGLIPFEYEFNNLTILLENQKIDIKKLDCRIKIIPLLNNKLSFKKFVADDISSESKKAEKLHKNGVYWPSFPIQVKFDQLQLNNLNFKVDNSVINLYVSGKAKIEKNGRIISSSFTIKRKNFSNSYLNITFTGIKENRFVELKGYMNIDTLKALDFLVKKDTFDISFDMNFQTNGSLDSYLGYLFNKEKTFSTIQGNGFGNIFNLKTKNNQFDFLSNKKSLFSFDFTTSNDLKIDISRFLIKNELFTIDLNAILTKNLILDKSNIALTVDDLSKIISKTFVSGSLNMIVKYDNTKINSTYNLENFNINNVSFADFTGNITCQLQQKVLSGEINTKFFTLDQIFNISSNFKLEKLFLDLTDLSIKSPSSSLNGNLTLTPALFVIGDGKVHFEDFKQIQILYPKFFFYGLTDIDFEFKQKVEEEKILQNLLVKLAVNDYRLDNFAGKNLDITMNIDNPFSKPSLDIEMLMSDLRYRDLNIDKLTFTTTTKEENWPYKTTFSGNLKHPFNVDSNGFWKMNKNEFILNIQDVSGYIFSHNFISPKPIKIEVSKDEFLLSGCSLEFPDSSIFADINFTKKMSQGKINLKHLPLDFLSVNPLDLDITGYATLYLTLEGTPNDLRGTMDLDLEELNVLSLGEKAPLQAYGKLKSEIKNNYLNLDGYLNIKETQFFSVKGEIPYDIDLIKLSFKPNTNKSINLSLKYNGKTEEILDFVNIGPQRIEGELNSQIELFNKLNNLEIKGFCSLKNGYYENYYTGTIIKDIEASLKASREKITLEYLKGKDTQNGEILAEGLFSISKEKNFPFYFKAQIKDFLSLDSEIFKALATANIEIAGDRFSSLAKGNVSIDNLDMTIPNKLPVIIPDLKPIFVYHPYQKDVKTEKLIPIIYPIHLNFDIDATKNPISVHGQGLTSTWTGFFKINGTYMNVETRGGLELIKGQYQFSGRKFDLIKGNVIFTGIPNGMPNLNIQAKINQQGVDIIAHMKGPLDTPKIFFTSSPPLPASSIMSLLIFGQQLSDLSPSQTVDLSSSMTSNLDSSAISKADSVSSLGIERFNVVQPSPTDPFATDQIAVQLGKYISKGVVISFSQGEEMGSSNIIVEVDLRKGLIFQAESQQQEEQGKFSLKYRYNY